MIITKEVPSSWQDLQDKVCKYLSQAGYKAETTKEIELVRGKAEVDVFATADDEMLKQFICECKYWEKPVPQEKIHAFRTVVHDSGSMFGIFISKNGYQKGAIEAAKCSNVILKDWEGFIDMISHKWLKKRFQNLLKISAPLSVYTNFLDVPLDKFSEKAKCQWEKLQNKYIHHYMLIKSLEYGFREPNKPVYVDGIRFDDFNSLFDYLESVINEGIKEFEELFSSNGIEGLKKDFSDKIAIQSYILDYLTKINDIK